VYDHDRRDDGHGYGHVNGNDDRDFGTWLYLIYFYRKISFEIVWSK
jgi:hypothetical protein